MAHESFHSGMKYFPKKILFTLITIPNGLLNIFYFITISIEQESRARRTSMSARRIHVKTEARARTRSMGTRARAQGHTLVCHISCFIYE